MQSEPQVLRPALLAFALAITPLCAQFPWSNSQQQQQQQQQGYNQGPVPNPGIVLPTFEQNRDPDNLSSKWIKPNQQGFPSFPPNLGGYGGYPAPPGWRQAPALGGGPLPSALPVQAGWPSWVQAKDGPVVQYTADKAVLLRQADRVWIKQQGEDAFVPLYHWDATRALSAGDQIRVAMTGEFMLMFHGGGRLQTFGPIEVTVDSLTEAEVHCTVASFTRLHISASGKPVYCALPDGSVLHTLPPDATTDATTAATTAAPSVKSGSALPTEVYLDREAGPFEQNGRGMIFNSGDRPVRWLSGAGEVQIEPGHRITFLMAKAQQSLPNSLVEDGLRAEQVGPMRRWLAPTSGSVTWSGARFTLPKDAALQLDPMIGDPFGQQQQQSQPKEPK
ncbi:hypothetical protein LBMAG49_05750 [Planctomycetota bacterium]|nr:hypothetical protein LBMAG49_05750 [Planctomycetota bacterium]